MRPFSQPAFAPLAVSLAALGLTVAILIVPPSLAWRHITKAPDAAARFRRVLAAGRPVSRLYALAGLRSADPATFRAALPELLGDTTVVAWRGSTAGWAERRVGELAAEIAPGSVTAGLASAPQVRPTCVE